MAAKTVRRLRFELTGPGIIEKSYETAGTAISAAITAADHYNGGEATFHVRDVTGEIVGWVERDEDGVVRIHRAKFIGATA
jgi:hypothetical protein